MPTATDLARYRTRILPVLTGPPVLAFLPALTLGAFWLGGEIALLLASLGLPLMFALAGALGKWPAGRRRLSQATTGLLAEADFHDALRRVFETTRDNGLKSCCLFVELDDFRELSGRYGDKAGELLVQRSTERILAALRQSDMVARLSGSSFGICLAPVSQLDLELCVQLAGRIQSSVEDPISLDAASVYVSCSIGFCQSNRSPGRDPRDWIGAAESALAEARLSGPSGIRAHSRHMRRVNRARGSLHADVAQALESGQIQPWYQPQISTDTGRITGFEALARWSHPVRGLLGPDSFLQAIEDAGLNERFGQAMLYHALTAVKAWDAAAVKIPRVGVNFSAAELRNPNLVDRIRWELDRFDLTTERLVVEILETVFENAPDDVVARNIAGLSALGCRIDLDDFGTGHASIASIRQFAISRIKIDRSFVMKADRDPEQQKLVAAILTMAERLDLETLAEGVETVGEHALLAQLGCGHVQGFGIGRPMLFDQTLDWIAAHDAKLKDTPRIEPRAG